MIDLNYSNDFLKLGIVKKAIASLYHQHIPAAGMEKAQPIHLIHYLVTTVLKLRLICL